VNTNDDDDNESGSTRMRWLLGTMLMLAFLCAIVWWPGCRQYPVASSPESLRLMRLLYSTCNTKDPTRLNQVKRDVETLKGQGKLTLEEQATFEQIIQWAKAGDWERAEKSAFQFAQDQVGQGVEKRASSPTGKHRD